MEIQSSVYLAQNLGMTSSDPPLSSALPPANRRDVLKRVACLAAGSSISPDLAAGEPETMEPATAGVVIVGGGPAGLSAALVAARARQEVLLIDGGTPRNAAAPALHTFVSRDGVLPGDFRRIARGQLAPYPTVQFRDRLVESISGEAGGFEVALAGGALVRCRYVILAMGLVDELPGIAGIKENWGKGVHHCVYCDGYEHRDEPWGLLVEDLAVLEHVPHFLGWTADLTVFTQGRMVQAAEVEKLRRQGIKVEPRPIHEVKGGSDGHAIEGVVLEDRGFTPLRALWVQPKQKQTPLVESLGLALREDGAVKRSETGETSRPGMFAAGDLSAGRMQQAILAAADGARVAYPIANLLIGEPVIA